MMKKSRHPSVFPALAAMLAVTVVGTPALFAQASPAEVPPVVYTTPEPKRGDQRFLNEAAKLGAEEIALAEVAASRAIHPAVRELAGMIARDHASAHRELASLADRKGVRLQTDPNAARNVTKKWNEKKAEDFDEDYLKEAKDTHEDAIDLFEKGIDSDDAEIATFARKVLPTLKGHLARIETVRKLVD